MNNHTPHTPFAPAHATLAHVLRHRAATTPDTIAYTFLADGAANARSITWSQLHHRAAALAASLQAKNATGQPVLLALPSGLAFVESLFACWYAGAIIVPVSLPRHQRVKHRLHSIIADAGAKFAIGAYDTRERLVADADDPAFANVSWIHPDGAHPDSAAFSLPQPDDIALLQYTSGSTGMPRGVVVTHSNLMANSAHIAEACGHAPGQTIAGWLPLFHDMGLIGLVLQAAFLGARCVLMAPERFLMRPWLWLQMISDYAAVSSPAPNFAYDLCTDRITADQKSTLNLTGWRNALNGSEPVRARTLDRFAEAFASCGFSSKAFFPCYGLAESTLFVTGPRERGLAPRRTTDASPLPDSDPSGHVGCGQPFGDTQLAIIDPQSSQPVGSAAIGEIWVAGQSVAHGYWNNPDATAATFNAHLADSSVAWLRTGDLGFIADQELFITGRLRDLIIISGKNHFPVDIERTVESADPAIAPSSAAAFSTDIAGLERLIVLAEVTRTFARSAPNSDADSRTDDYSALRRRLVAAVVAENEVTAHDVILLRPGTLPRTSSGKISRRAARDAYLNQTLERMECPVHASASS